jgi:hypothetical protein
MRGEWDQEITLDESFQFVSTRRLSPSPAK